MVDTPVHLSSVPKDRHPHESLDQREAREEARLTIALLTTLLDPTMVLEREDRLTLAMLFRNYLELTTEPE